MTTNERMNAGRYGHFISAGHSPFDRGRCQNIVDFFQLTCLGICRPEKTDWLTTYHIPTSVPGLVVNNVAVGSSNGGLIVANSGSSSDVGAADEHRPLVGNANMAKLNDYPFV